MVVKEEMRNKMMMGRLEEEEKKRREGKKLKKVNVATLPSKQLFRIHTAPFCLLLHFYTLLKL